MTPVCATAVSAGRPAATKIEDPGVFGGIEVAEERRPEEDPGQHLADDRRLPEPPQHESHETGRGDDDRQLHRQL
jgi:hypothetical protein